MIAKKSKKRRRGAGKGQNFERTICRVLSLWVSGGKHIDLYWRSAMSGGRATRHGTDVRQSGDIACVAPEGHNLTDRYVIECKFYRDLALSSFFFKRKGILWKFWVKLIAEAHRRGKYAMLIARQNNHPDIVLTNDLALVEWAGWEWRGAPDCHVLLLRDMIKQPFKVRFNNGKVKKRQPRPITGTVETRL